MSIDDIVKIIKKVTEPLRRKVVLMVGHGIVESTNDSGDIQLIQGSLLKGETNSKIRKMHQYGFSSNAPAGSEFILVSVAGNREAGVAIASENRATRIKNLSPGDSIIYNADGTFIHMKGANIEAKLSKIKIENDSYEMIAVMSEFMDKVINGLVFTAIGPQPWIPATKTELLAIKAKLDSFKV